MKIQVFSGVIQVFLGVIQLFSEVTRVFAVEFRVILGVIQKEAPRPIHIQAYEATLIECGASDLGRWAHKRSNGSLAHRRTKYVESWKLESGYSLYWRGGGRHRI